MSSCIVLYHIQPGSLLAVFYVTVVCGSWFDASKVSAVTLRAAPIGPSRTWHKTAIIYVCWGTAEVSQRLSLDMSCSQCYWWRRFSEVPLQELQRPSTISPFLYSLQQFARFKWYGAFFILQWTFNSVKTIWLKYFYVLILNKAQHKNYC